ncbi:ATP-binding cassette domain-containing protein [Alicyclobacillus fastidiosus]|uniref:ATP-binding cassette domain-containing protein n=1 Tax=Alicyclobacillus fastidiosus TaxID=392011 RepID=UPI0035C8B069
MLDRISVSIYRNECTAIVGPNGSGKSTVLRLIAGLIPAGSGTREVSVTQIKIGYVPDRFPILRFTPKEYLLDMGRLQGIPATRLQKRVEELLTFLI